MAKSGILGQSKPAATTNTILYKAPIDKSASAVLTIANDGTGAAYDIALKDYDQNLTMDASTYLFHEGDVVTNHRFTLDQNFTTSTRSLLVIQLLVQTPRRKQSSTDFIFLSSLQST